MTYARMAMDTIQLNYLSPSEQKGLDTMTEQIHYQIVSSDITSIVNIIHAYCLIRGGISISTSANLQYQLRSLINVSADPVDYSALLYGYQKAKQSLIDCYHSIYPANDHDLKQRQHIIEATRLPHISDRTDSHNLHLAPLLRILDKDSILGRYQHTWNGFQHIDPFSAFGTDQLISRTATVSSIIGSWKNTATDILLRYQLGLQEVLSSIAPDQVQRQSYRLNKHNTDSVLLNRAHEDLSALIEEMIEEPLINLAFESVPHSYGKQYEKTSELVTLLKYASSWIHEQASYNEWKYTYQNTDDSSQRMMRQLSEIDDIDERLKFLDGLIRKSKLYDLIESGIPIASDKELTVIELARDLRSSPIQMSFENRNPDTVMLDYEDGQYRISKGTYENLLVVESRLTDISALASLSHAEQMRQAKLLTMSLDQLQPTATIYQSKLYNIMSFLADHQNEMLNRLLQNEGLKEIRNEHRTDGYTESILHFDREQVLWINDDLLDVHAPESYIWQRTLIQALSESGYRVCSFKTIDLCNGATITELWRAQMSMPESSLNTVQ